MKLMVRAHDLGVKGAENISKRVCELSLDGVQLVVYKSIDGVSYAASMNGMPHGTGSITTNNFDGHHCIHFLNSRTHTGNRWDTQHQAMVQKAYKAGQK